MPDSHDLLAACDEDRTLRRFIARRGIDTDLLLGETRRLRSATRRIFPEDNEATRLAAHWVELAYILGFGAAAELDEMPRHDDALCGFVVELVALVAPDSPNPQLELLMDLAAHLAANPARRGFLEHGECLCPGEAEEVLVEAALAAHGTLGDWPSGLAALLAERVGGHDRLAALCRTDRHTDVA